MTFGGDSVSTSTTRCPACEGPKHPSHYLCPVDWRQLSRTTRSALWRRDGKAPLRLLQLMRQINDGVPLAEITVTL
jgi:hypothetical protein